MPYIPENLYTKIYHDGWRPNWPDVLHLSRRLSQGLASIHEAGILHRDLKPGNILLDHHGMPYICDFGIAISMADLKVDDAGGSGKGKPSGGFHKSNMVGTLEYMSPETLQKQPPTDKSDVWALAVTLNEVATGTFPYSDCTQENPAAHTVLEMGYGRYVKPSLVQVSSIICQVLCLTSWISKCDARKEQAGHYATFPDGSKSLLNNSECNTVTPDGQTGRLLCRQQLAAAIATDGLLPMTKKDTPAPLAALLKACWSLNPSARPSAQQMLQAFQEMNLDSSEPANLGGVHEDQPHCTGAQMCCMKQIDTSAHDVCINQCMFSYSFNVTASCACLQMNGRIKIL